MKKYYLILLIIEEPIINILYKKFEPVINADKYIYFPNDCANRSPFILCRKWINDDSVIIDKWYNIFTKCWEYDKKQIMMHIILLY